MKKFILFSLIICSATFANGQDILNMSLIAQVDTEAKANDIWGFVDKDGIEYAILGTRQETFIFDLSDPSNPVEMINIPGNNTVWRDFKDVNNFVYGTADAGNHGLLIIDMNSPQDSIPWKYYNEEITVGDLTSEWGNCHNLYVDDDGLGYFSGCDFNAGGVIIFDLISDPWLPRYVGKGIAQYSHDNFSRDSIIYSADISAGTFTIQDARDMENVILLGEESTTSNFTHNIWPSDDGKYVFTTDEKAYGNLDAYDVSDPNNIERLDFYRPEKTKNTPTIPHNTHYLDGFLITSWYTDGLVVVDGNKPDNLIPVAQYDTYLEDQFSYNGCWGAYPYLPSGIIIGADIQGGLFVMEPSYARACYLEGTINSEAMEIINNATIEIIDPFLNSASSKSNGTYKTGFHASGTFDVLYTHPDYYDTIYTVELAHGEVTTQDVIMRAKKVFHFQAMVRDASTKEGIPEAKIEFSNDEDTYIFTTNDEGIANLTIREGNYNVYTGAWAFQTYTDGLFELVNEPGTLIYDLNPGYRDEFALDLGWDLENFADGGIWEIGEPRGTVLQPDLDIQTDIGDQCYVTGNNGNAINDDDLDGGKTTIITPDIDLSTYENPMLQFSYWFANFDLNGNVSSEDSIIVLLSQEGQVDQLLAFENIHELDWKQSEKISLNDFSFNPDEAINIKFSVADRGEFNWLEAAIDHFEITDSITTSILPLDMTAGISVFPNPTATAFKLSFEKGSEDQVKTIELVDQLGNKVLVLEAATIGSQHIFGADLSPGTYTILVHGIDQVYSQKLVKID